MIVCGEVVVAIKAKTTKANCTTVKNSMTLQNQTFADWIKPPIKDAWFLTGPTASGKSRVALELAERIDAEIISVDSMAVYRGMDIGTAKPTSDQRERIPHHLIDLIDPTSEYSVSQFVVDAHSKADEVRARGRKVLLVGGTPLYIKTLFCGMFLGPPADWDFRAAVEADVAEFGIESLRKRLEQVDPLSAYKILDGDVRRMTRALEVAKITGRPLSHWQNQFEQVQGTTSCKCFALAWERSQLHNRVNLRVDSMFHRGLLDEVKTLIVKFGALGRTAAQAVGYKEPMEFLKGAVKEKDMVEQVKAHTRQFVRRQEIWFRSMPSIQRVPIASEIDLDRAAEMITIQSQV